MPNHPVENWRKMAFDFEGTLVDLEGFHQKAFEAVADRLGLKFGPKEFTAFVGAGDAAIAEEIARLGKLTHFELDPEEIRKAKTAVYRDMLHSHTITPREGVPEYLEKSKLLVGCDLVIASITPDEDAMRIIDESRLRAFFRYVLTETSVTKKKPDPEVYIYTSENEFRI